jgi:hypothetical protein
MAAGRRIWASASRMVPVVFSSPTRIVTGLPQDLSRVSALGPAWGNVLGSSAQTHAYSRRKNHSTQAHMGANGLATLSLTSVMTERDATAHVRGGSYPSPSPSPSRRSQVHAGGLTHHRAESHELGWNGIIEHGADGPHSGGVLRSFRSESERSSGDDNDDDGYHHQ